MDFELTNQQKKTPLLAPEFSKNEGNESAS